MPNKEEKLKFIHKHRRRFKKTRSSWDYQLKFGREIVALAREELGYSDKTASCDVFAGLFRLSKSYQPVMNGRNLEYVPKGNGKGK